MNDKPKKRSWGWVGWAALVVFVLYPLSIGPVWWVCSQTEPDWIMQTYGAFYAPLLWVGEHNETIENMLWAYGGWWTPTNNVPMPE